MRLRNWLLTGSSLGLMVLAPVTVVQAQDAALIAAYEQFVAASSSGDADATTTAQNAFLAECARVGVPDANECIALIQNGPAPAAEPAPAEEPAPEAAPETAPEAQAPAEQPAPEPAPAEPAPAEPAPVEQPAPVEPPAEQPAPVEAQPAPEPAQVEQQPAQAEQPAPAEQPPAVQPAPEQPAQPAIDISAGLQAAVALYSEGIADLMAGGDATAAQAKIEQARAQMDTLCAQGGFASTEECLAANGLELPEVPAVTAPPAEQPPAEQPAAEQPAPGTPPAAETPAEVPTAEEAEEQPVNDQAVEVVPNLPANVTADEVAPLLDSAKDLSTDAAAGQPAPEAPPAPTEPAAPPPETDQAAQAEIQPEQVVSIQEEKGQTLDAAPVAEVPQNVTIINNNTTVVNNNTTVNNTTTTNTTNNTTNNNNSTNVNVSNTQVLLQIGAQVIIQNRDQERDRFVRDDQDEIYYEQLDRGRVRETIERPDGSRIVTIRNRNGDILQRSRFTPDGREIILAYFDDRYDNDLLEWRDPGRDLPPLRLTIPVRDYVLDVEDADEDEVEIFFRQPPVEQVRRIYSIDEVKRSARVRDSVRRIEVGGLTFDTGAATISRDQVAALSKVAAAMVATLKANPAETFLIEGHTDAVGSDIANLRLSDLRAATVARILTDFYDIPPENLATQGYGERYLKIKTDGAERLNRRVTIRRITPLVTPVANR